MLYQMKRHENGSFNWSTMKQRTKYKRNRPIVAYIDDDQVNCYTAGSSTTESMIPHESTTDLQSQGTTSNRNFDSTEDTDNTESSTTEILQSTTENAKSGGKILVYTGYGYNGTKAEVIDLLNENLECDLYATLPVETYNALGGKVNNDFLFIYEPVFIDEPECYIVGQDTPTAYEPV